MFLAIITTAPFHTLSICKLILDEILLTKSQLIFESPFIKENRWKPFKLQFTPKKSYKYIYIEAWHQNNSKGYKSNILIDALAPIEPCPRA